MACASHACASGELKKRLCNEKVEYCSVGPETPMTQNSILVPGVKNFIDRISSTYKNEHFGQFQVLWSVVVPSIVSCIRYPFQSRILPAAFIYFVTTRPLLLIMRSPLHAQWEVFSFLPLKTAILARLPFAILLTDFFFITFIVFVFMAVAFADFMDFITVFMGNAFSNKDLSDGKGKRRARAGLAMRGQ